MPLNGFRILDWASRTFGGLPPALVGGFGVAVLLIGIFFAVSAFRMSPISYSLMAAGFGMIVLSYFVIGSAVMGASSELAGGDQVASAAPRYVPMAASAVLFGLGLFGGRAALRLWASEESSGKAFALATVMVAACAVFVGVQVMRGSAGLSHADSSADDPDQQLPPDEPIGRGATRSHSR